MNYRQAPSLYYNEDLKMKNKQNGFTTRSVELETAIMNGCSTVGELKVMLFLTGNAGDGSFKVPEATVLDRCGISERTYDRAKKALKEKGWISCETGKSITVNLDVILGCQVDTPKKEEKIERCQDDTPEKCQVDTPKRCQDDTYNNINNNIINNITKEINENPRSATLHSDISLTPKEAIREEEKEVVYDIDKYKRKIQAKHNNSFILPDGRAITYARA